MSATYWISSQLIDDRDHSHHLDELVEHYLDVIENKLETQSLNDFQSWLDTQRFPRGIGIAVIDENASVIAKKRIPKAVIKAFQQTKRWPFADDSRIKLKQKDITSVNGVALKLSVLLFPKKSHFDSPDHSPWFSKINKRTPGWGVFRLLIALTISAIVCYFLARHLSKPIIKLRNAVNDLGKGKFETNVSGEFKKRNDEIAELATDFDNMAEKLRDQFKQREDLLRDISHELRSPLARMRVASELIKSKTRDLNLKEVPRIESEISLLDTLIGEILEFSKLGNEKSMPEFSHFELKVLLTEIIDDANFEVNSQNKSVTLTDNLDKQLKINANRQILQRALENIIRNAIKYTPAHSQVNVILSRHSQTIKINITDHGPGVNDEELAKIFEPFYRVSESRSRKSGGTGLGLAIARRAILLHKGKISAINRKEQGLQINIELPVSSY